jgi:branched-chain amino acid transport system substrate-binding protein
MGAALLLGSAGACARPVKVGFISTFSGPQARTGELMGNAVKLYMKLNAGKLPPGVTIDLITRDDGGLNPDRARQVAQELILRDKVQLLAGVVTTPNAAAIAPLTLEARVPLVIMNASASVLTTLSPYIVRTSFTIWQSAYPMGQWAGKRYRRAYVAASDFAPGQDAEAAFDKGFSTAGGEIVGRVRIPLTNPDFVRLMQRARDTRPEIVFGFVAGLPQGVEIMKAFRSLGLTKAGITFVSTGEIVDDAELPRIGDAALGAITASHYSVAGDRPANRAFLAAWKREYGPQSIPDFMSVGAWDGMDAIFYAIRKLKGNMDPDKTIAVLKTYRNPDSPRGPIRIDPETRDIVQNEYIRETRRVNGELANVEMETIRDVHDFWKTLSREK